MSILRSGSWYLNSDTDPRWNFSGRSDSCGGFMMPPECKIKLKELKETIGDPPEDLAYGYMKD